MHNGTACSMSVQQAVGHTSADQEALTLNQEAHVDRRQGKETAVGAMMRHSEGKGKREKGKEEGPKDPRVSVCPTLGEWSDHQSNDPKHPPTH